MTSPYAVSEAAGNTWGRNGTHAEAPRVRYLCVRRVQVREAGRVSPKQRGEETEARGQGSRSCLWSGRHLTATR